MSPHQFKHLISVAKSVGFKADKDNVVKNMRLRLKKTESISFLDLKSRVSNIRGMLLYMLRNRAIVFNFQPSTHKFCQVVYYKCKEWNNYTRTSINISATYQRLFCKTILRYMIMYREYLLYRYSTPLKRFLPWDTIGDILSYL